MCVYVYMCVYIYIYTHIRTAVLGALSSREPTAQARDIFLFIIMIDLVRFGTWRHTPTFYYHMI